MKTDTKKTWDSVGKGAPCRVAAFRLLTLAAVVLILISVAVPAVAGDDAKIEGIHIESLIAQSIDIERRFENQNLFLGDKYAEDYLTEILQKLATPRERSIYMLRVRVLRSNAVNAFAAPHGSIFITTALLARVESEAQAAAILAHELIHIVNHHAAKNLVARKSSARRHAPARQNMSLLLGDGIAGSITGAVMRSAMSGYNRELEREADSIGLVRMIAAGYPHAEFQNLFVMLSGYLAAENIKEAYFFSTHPRMVERIENYRRIITGGGIADSSGGGAKTASDYKPDELDRGYFSARIASVILYDAQMNCAAGKFYIAEELLDRLLAINQNDVQALILRGDMERMLSPRSTAFVEWYERALAREPDNLTALRAMGFAYHAIGGDEKAREYLSRYRELAGDGATDIRMVMELLRQIGEAK